MRKHSTNTKFIFNNSSHTYSLSLSPSFFLKLSFGPLRPMPSSHDALYDNIYFVHGIGFTNNQTSQLNVQG